MNRCSYIKIIYNNIYKIYTYNFFLSMIFLLFSTKYAQLEFEENLDKVIEEY